MTTLPWIIAATAIAAVGGAIGGGPLAATVAAGATATGAWALLSRSSRGPSVPAETESSEKRLRDLNAAIALLEDERELHRGLFEISTELVGCVEESDARNRFAAAARRYWDCTSADLLVWDKGSWRSLGGPATGLPPVLDHPVQLPGNPRGLSGVRERLDKARDLHENDGENELVLDLSPGVTGQAALVLRHARVQPSLIGRDRAGQLAVAEILRGQLALSLRRVILYSDLKALARIDPLTTTHRRWYGESRLKELVDGGDVVAVAMVDIDHFKLINDGHGHSAGDQVLAALGRTLVTVLRSNDLVCRWGGEEFLIVLPDTPPAGALLMADRLRQAIAALKGLPTPVTVSIGIAACAQDDTPFDLVARADEALYAAKSGGRDRVSVADVTPAVSTLRITSRRAKDRTSGTFSADLERRKTPSADDPA